MMMRVEDAYRQYKPLLFSIAYRMLGRVTEAEDIVQETFLTLVQSELDDIHHLKTYLCKAVTNKCLDRLKSAGWRREQYVGEWLPEPLLDDTKRADPLDALVMEENVSYGLLVLLETLSPAERAVYVLRSVLDCPYREIASMLEKTESACRKLYSRAQEKLKGLDVQAKAHPVQAKNLVEQLMQAIVREDADALLSLLTQDAVLVSDGGGKVKAALRPIRSAQHVAAFLLGVSRKWPEERKVQFCSMNGQTGVVIRESGSTIINIVLAPGMERIQTIYILRNPEKLNHLS